LKDFFFNRVLPFNPSCACTPRAGSAIPSDTLFWIFVMPITVVSSTASGANLTWADFTTVAPPMTDPADGEPIDAYTTFNYQLTNGTPVASGGNFKVAEPNTLRITPNARVTSTTTKTAGLLAHEAFHYDLGFCIARVVAKRLAAIVKPSAAEVTAEGLKILRYHFHTRAGIIQRRYDKDTHHGTVARYQAVWLTRMTACKGNANATQIGGFYL
jgi:hypothetical protein